MEKTEDKFVLIRGGEDIAAFTSYHEALCAGYKRFGLQPFLVKPVCSPQKPIPMCSPPILLLAVGVSNPRLAILKELAQPIPEPQPARASIDTGSVFSFIGPAMVRALNLSPTGLLEIYALGTPEVKVFACNAYDVAIYFSENQSIGIVQVLESSGLGQFGADVILGRNILQFATFLYDPRAGKADLSF